MTETYDTPRDGSIRDGRFDLATCVDSDGGNLRSIRAAVSTLTTSKLHHGLTVHRLRSIFAARCLPEAGWTISPIENPFRAFYIQPLYRERIALECESIDGGRVTTVAVDARLGWHTKHFSFVIDVATPDGSFRLERKV